MRKDILVKTGAELTLDDEYESANQKGNRQSNYKAQGEIREIQVCQR